MLMFEWKILVVPVHILYCCHVTFGSSWHYNAMYIWRDTNYVKLTILQNSHENNNRQEMLPS